MPMDKAQLDKVHDHVRKYVGACKICGHTHWEVEQEIAATMTLDFQNKAVNAGVVLPFAMAYCKNCRNTVMFNATKLGLL